LVCPAELIEEFEKSLRKRINVAVSPAIERGVV
jgi:hypothetical protein